MKKFILCALAAFALAFVLPAFHPVPPKPTEHSVFVSPSQAVYSPYIMQAIASVPSDPVALSYVATDPESGITYNHLAVGKEAAISPPPGTDVSFKTITAVGDSVATCNAWYSEFQNWSISAADSFRLVLTKLKNGGTYRILIKKTVSGVVRVHYTGSTYYILGGGTSFTLTGATNSYFWLSVTNNGTVNIIKYD